MKPMIPGGCSSRAFTLTLALLAACTPSSSDEKPEPETPTPITPPVVQSVSCDRGQEFWTESALEPLEAQLRKRLPVENEYWLGTVDGAVVCELLRPSCPESEYLTSYFTLICPDAKSSTFLAPETESAEKLQEICTQKEPNMFHSCQSVLTERLIEKAFVPVADRPRFYKLKSE